MFDFDGTLSKISEIPKEAYLEKSTKDLLEKISKHSRVAIVSGRSLPDIKNKIKLPNLIYSGNHGFEWEINGKKDSIKISQVAKKTLEKARKEFKILAKSYSGVLIEGKSFGFSVHYRNLLPKKAKSFLQESKRRDYFLDRDGLILIIKGKKVLEFRPNIDWSKGRFAEFLLNRPNRKFSAVYVGDDTTDESAFCVLKKGITVRIGKKQRSCAEYFIKKGEIDKLLSCFIVMA